MRATDPDFEADELDEAPEPVGLPEPELTLLEPDPEGFEEELTWLLDPDPVGTEAELDPEGDKLAHSEASRAKTPLYSAVVQFFWRQAATAFW